MVIFKQVAERIAEQSTSITQLTVGLVRDEDGVLPVSGTKITEIFVVVTRHKTSLLESYANKMASCVVFRGFT